MAPERSARYWGRAAPQHVLESSDETNDNEEVHLLAEIKAKHQFRRHLVRRSRSIKKDLNDTDADLAVLEQRWQDMKEQSAAGAMRPRHAGLSPSLARDRWQAAPVAEQGAQFQFLPHLLPHNQNSSSSLDAAQQQLGWHSTASTQQHVHPAPAADAAAGATRAEGAYLQPLFSRAADNLNGAPQNLSSSSPSAGAPHPFPQAPQFPHPHPYPYHHQQQQPQLPGPHHGYQQPPSQPDMGNRHSRGRVSLGNPHPRFRGASASRQQGRQQNVQGGVQKRRVYGPIGPTLHNTKPPRPAAQQDDQPNVVEQEGPAPAPHGTPPAAAAAGGAAAATASATAGVAAAATAAAATAGGAAAAAAAASTAGAGAGASVASSNPARIGRGTYKPRTGGPRALPTPDLTGLQAAAPAPLPGGPAGVVGATEPPLHPDAVQLGSLEDLLQEDMDDCCWY